MKKILLALLLLFTIQLSAQNFSTINFIATKGSGIQTYNIYLNQQLVGTIQTLENLEYKIYSEGRISVIFIIGEYRYTKSIDVKNGNTYYYEANFLKASYELVNEAKGKELLAKNTNTIKAEEDIKNPIGKLPEAPKSGKGQGTCFLINADGYFLTNFHCIENAKEITIKGIDGDFTTKYGAILIASDPSNDLALVKIVNKNVKFNVPPYAIRSSGVAQAEKVYALGFPMADAMGQEMKITDGIISAKSGVQGDVSKFQISAPVNPGNSGGPLIDEQGNLIGVIYAKSTLAESAGYAIKASYLESFLKNVDGFNFPNLTNTLKDKSFTDKINLLKGYIYIIETN